MKRKKEIEPITEDGFTPMEMRTNFSLKCEVCGKYPKKSIGSQSRAD